MDQIAVRTDSYERFTWIIAEGKFLFLGPNGYSWYESNEEILLATSDKIIYL